MPLSAWLSHCPRIVYRSRGTTAVTAECDRPMSSSRGLMSDALVAVCDSIVDAAGRKGSNSGSSWRSGGRTQASRSLDWQAPGEGLLL
jgi:hypothetical protein